MIFLVSIRVYASIYSKMPPVFQLLAPQLATFTFSGTTDINIVFIEHKESLICIEYSLSSKGDLL